MQPSLRLLSGTFITLFIISCYSCNREKSSVQIIGKWKGALSISKHTTYINGIISFQNSDTTNWTKPGYTLLLEFSETNKAELYYEKPGYVRAVQGGSYSLNSDKLKFSGNPFSYHSSDAQFGLYPIQPPDQQDICTVAELSNNKMVLYDKNTTNNVNSIIIWEQWNSFIK